MMSHAGMSSVSSVNVTGSISSAPSVANTLASKLTQANEAAWLKLGILFTLN